jgi:hypothetical protein
MIIHTNEVIDGVNIEYKTYPDGLVLWRINEGSHRTSWEELQGMEWITRAIERHKNPDTSGRRRLF